MTELQSKWFTQVEKYYGAKYPAVMRQKVAEILPDRYEVLKALFDHVIGSVPAQYKAVPDLIAVRKSIREVAEAYPEFDPHSYNSQIASGALQITDRAGFFPPDLWAEVLKAAGVSEEAAEQRRLG